MVCRSKWELCDAAPVTWQAARLEWYDARGGLMHYWQLERLSVGALHGTCANRVGRHFAARRRRAG